MKGIDVSGWQEDSIIEKSLPDFIMIKASEGVDYKSDGLDRLYTAWINYRKKHPQVENLYGFYHYARPETGNTPRAEADSFLSYVGHHAGSALFALDYEGSALKYGVKWAKEFLQRVESVTGSRPVLYIQKSAIVDGTYKDLSMYPLWLAWWSDQNGNSALGGTGWKSCIMQQYTDNYKGLKVDGNNLYITGDDWRKLCKGNGSSDIWRITYQSENKIIMEK